MWRMRKSGIDRMKIGYEWGMYKSGKGERNKSDIDVAVE